MKKARVLLPLADAWRPLFFILCGAALLGGALTYRLGTLTPQFTEAEAAMRASTSSAQALSQNPLHPPQKIGQFALQKLGKRGPEAMRLPSAAVGILALVSMFIILKNWYSPRVAAFGTLLFGTSSWFLHTARLATPDINFVLPTLLIVAGIWMHKLKYMSYAVLLSVVSAMLLLYIPGMIWFLVAVLVWQRDVFRRAFRHMSYSWQITIVLLIILGLAPMVWSFAYHPDLIRTWLGLPAIWPTSVLAYLKSIIEVPLQIFLRGSGNPVIGIDGLPLLDIFTSTMVVLGVFASLKHLGLDRTRLLGVFTFISILLIALKGPVSISFFLPLIYLLAAGGIALFLQQWFTVFPRNPAARWLALVMISGLLTITANYHIRHYFIAWPNVPATKQAFNIQP